MISISYLVVSFAAFLIFDMICEREIGFIVMMMRMIEMMREIARADERESQNERENGKKHDSLAIIFRVLRLAADTRVTANYPEFYP